MRRVVVVEYVSLDGVMQAPGHAGEDSEGGFEHGGWTGPFMAEHGRYMSDRFRAAGAFLFGRLTYEIWAEYWPTVTDERDDIAGALNSLPKYVASTTLREPTWTGTTVLSADVPGEVAALKEQPGRDLFVFGSSGLTRTLMDHGLVDEYQLWVHPVVLGGGKRLFDERAPTTSFKLVDAVTTQGGLVGLTYEPLER